MVPLAYDLVPYLAALGRRWSLEREVRDDARDVVHVRDNGKESRLRSTNARRADKPCPYLPIFRRIWPRETGRHGRLVRRLAELSP